MHLHRCKNVVSPYRSFTGGTEAEPPYREMQVTRFAFNPRDPALDHLFPGGIGAIFGCHRLVLLLEPPSLRRLGRLKYFVTPARKYLLKAFANEVRQRIGRISSV